MSTETKNVDKIEKKLIVVLELLDKAIVKHPEHYDTLNPVFELAKIHSKNMIFVKQILHNGVDNEMGVDEKTFKNFIIDANDFCIECKALMTKHFPNI